MQQKEQGCGLAAAAFFGECLFALILSVFEAWRFSVSGLEGFRAFLGLGIFQRLFSCGRTSPARSRGLLRSFVGSVSGKHLGPNYVCGTDTAMFFPWYCTSLALLIMTSINTDYLVKSVYCAFSSRVVLAPSKSTSLVIDWTVAF